MSDPTDPTEPTGFGLFPLEEVGALDDLDDLDEFAVPDNEEADELAGPVHWPSVDVEDSANRMVELWVWVQQFQRRFPEMVRLPDCWPHHNSLVELLQSIADYERGAFLDDAPPTAAVGWHLVVRDIEQRLRGWLSELPCKELAADKDEVHAPPGPAPDWRTDTHLNHWLDARDVVPDVDDAGR